MKKGKSKWPIVAALLLAGAIVAEEAGVTPPVVVRLLGVLVPVALPHEVRPVELPDGSRPSVSFWKWQALPPLPGRTLSVA